jgi:hypothetical protein
MQDIKIYVSTFSGIKSHTDIIVVIINIYFISSRNNHLYYPLSAFLIFATILSSLDTSWSYFSYHSWPDKLSPSLFRWKPLTSANFILDRILAYSWTLSFVSHEVEPITLDYLMLTMLRFELRYGCKLAILITHPQSFSLAQQLRKLYQVGNYNVLLSGK